MSDALSRTPDGDNSTAVPTVARVELMARQAHGVQKDRDGSLHIEHVARVADSVPEDYRRVAWLHDTLEDTDLTLTEIRDLGVPDIEVEAVRFLSRPNSLDYFDYITSLTNCDCNIHLMALVVKEADLLDNLRRCIRAGDSAVKRYRKALYLIYEAAA